LLEDESDDNENKADELFEIWEVAGKETVTESMDSLFFDLKALTSSSACVFCSDLFLRVVCQWCFISLSDLPGNPAAIADHMQVIDCSVFNIYVLEQEFVRPF